MKKKTIILITIALILSVTIVFLVFFNSNNSLKHDDDTGFYRNEYMTYNNGVLTVKDPKYNYIDTYYLNENKKDNISIDEINVRKNIEKYDSKIIYFVANSAYNISHFTSPTYYDLLVYDTETETKNIVANQCLSVVFCKNKVAYTDDAQNIYLYDVSSDKSELICNEFDREIHEIQSSDDYLYIFSTKDTICYVTIFDVNTNSKISDFKIDENFTQYIVCAYNDKAVIIKPASKENVEVNGFSYELIGKNEYKFYDLNGKASDISRIGFVYAGPGPSFYNNDYLYYCERDYSSNEVYEKTIDNPNNGVYMTHLKTNETKKLSEECEFESILATDNYIYCYTINYSFPQEILKLNAVNGYSIKQIPIK